jgi:hypothetical protein
MRHRPWTTPDRHLYRRASFALLAAFALVAVACGEDDDSGGGTEPASGAAPTDTGAGGAGGALSIAIDEPSDGADVTGEFTVRMTPSVEVGEPETGLHHIHLYYDGDTDEGDYDIVYGDTTTVTRPLDPGQHTIEAVIANADHSLTDARTAITVNVTESAPGGTGTATTAPLYDY